MWGMVGDSSDAQHVLRGCTRLCGRWGCSGAGGKHCIISSGSDLGKVYRRMRKEKEQKGKGEVERQQGRVRSCGVQSLLALHTRKGLVA